MAELRTHPYAADCPRGPTAYANCGGSDAAAAAKVDVAAATLTGYNYYR